MTPATLEDVVRGLAATGGAIEEVVTQDEFTHDVIVREGARWLVYDTT